MNIYLLLTKEKSNPILSDQKRCSPHPSFSSSFSKSIMQPIIILLLLFFNLISFYSFVYICCNVESKGKVWLDTNMENFYFIFCLFKISCMWHHLSLFIHGTYAIGSCVKSFYINKMQYNWILSQNNSIEKTNYTGQNKIKVSLYVNVNII